MKPEDHDVSEFAAAADDPEKLEAMLAGLGSELTDEEREELELAQAGYEKVDGEAKTGDEPGTDADAGGDTDTAKVDGEGDQAAADADADKTKTDPGDGQGEGEGESKQVIKTRDGKHEIPYSVLENERRRARDLEQRVAEQERQLEEMKRAAAGAGKKGDSTDTTDTGEGFDLEAMREEYGDDYVRPFEVLQRKIDAQNEELRQAREWRESQQKQAEQSIEDQVEEAIDLVFADAREPGKPSIMRQWQESNIALWNAAAAMDATLREDPAWADKPLRERFEHIVTELGHAPRKAPPTDQNDEQKELDRKLAEKDRDRIPSSLSDLPGGDFPDQTLTETIDRMSPKELEAKLASMTQEQAEEFLARL